jgi:hypothetical protein
MAQAALTLLALSIVLPSLPRDISGRQGPSLLKPLLFEHFRLRAPAFRIQPTNHPGLVVLAGRSQHCLASAAHSYWAAALANRLHVTRPFYVVTEAHLGGMGPARAPPDARN